MPIVVELRREDGSPIRHLPDPAAGTFDAAGGFDRLVDDRFPALGAVDPPPTVSTLTLDLFTDGRG